VFTFALQVSCRKHAKLTDEERKDTQVSMKIFLCCPSDTDRGVKESLETCKFSPIDSFVIFHFQVFRLKNPRYHQCADCSLFVAAMNLLGLEFVESVIVSMPTGGEDADKKLKASWQQLESLVRANRVLTIGCSDISTQQLQELCEWAQVITILTTNVVALRLF
jgi:diketogulonate reductase-like aldo/keto reductase